jgi:coniferyl-aldehyde dehydrogenase
MNPKSKVLVESGGKIRPQVRTNEEELHKLFEAQKDAFQKNMYLSYEQRIEALKAIESMVLDCRSDAEEALTEDFCTHPPLLTTSVELLLVFTRSKFVRSNLKKWMKPQSRSIDRMAYGLGRCYVTYQPLGVVGIMGPWNVPILATLAPLVDVLASGNRAIIKPSELAPACAALLKEMVSRSFEPDHVAVVTGEVDLAQEFARMPWDHLLYTGGAAVGKLVMKAASENLTPVTLELGGKCPVIIIEDRVDKGTVSDILACKIVKNGQACISPDYVFVPESQRDRFVSLCRKIMPSMLPSYSDSSHCTGIINEQHLDRLISYLEDAEQKGARLVQLYSSDEPVNRKERKMPFTLVLDPGDEMEVMKNEIFGPIIPVMTYRNLDEAISYVNNHERPLALYCYTKDMDIAGRVLRETISGGACINSVAAHVLHPSLPFGGVGNSGMGEYGGFEGFKTFSNQRSIYKRGWSLIGAEAFYPPYGKKMERLIKIAFK